MGVRIASGKELKREKIEIRAGQEPPINSDPKVVEARLNVGEGGNNPKIRGAAQIQSKKKVA